MVAAPRPPVSKPRKSHKPATTETPPIQEDDTEASTTVPPSGPPARQEDSVHVAKLTIVVPSCSQNVRWIGQGFGWPLGSKHACLNCCHKFEGPPVGLPVRYDDRTDGFHLSGNFCSFSCCKRHILEARRSDTVRLIDNLALLAIKAHKQNVRLRAAPKHYIGVATAPPKTALQMFGGGMSIEEFRKGSVRVTEVLAKEPFARMSWADALVAVRSNAPIKVQIASTERTTISKPYAVGRTAPIRRKNTLDAFLKS